jgi:hypothetical protein
MRDTHRFAYNGRVLASCLGAYLLYPAGQEK